MQELKGITRLNLEDDNTAISGREYALTVGVISREPVKERTKFDLLIIVDDTQILVKTFQFELFLNSETAEGSLVEIPFMVIKPGPAVIKVEFYSNSCFLRQMTCEFSVV